MHSYYGCKSVFGPVTRLDVSRWLGLVRQRLTVPVPLGVTRADFAALCARIESLQPATGAAKSLELIALEKRKLTIKNTFGLLAGVYTADGVERHNENIIGCRLVTIDVDDAAQAARLLEHKDSILDLNHVIYHTTSSTDAAPRLRVVVDAEFFPQADYPKAVHHICDRLGLDKPNSESLRPNQPMFLPSQFEGESPRALVAQVNAGKPLDHAAFAHYTVAAAGRDYGLDDPLSDFSELPLPEITVEMIRPMVMALDADMGRNEWLKVAMALKHQFAHSSEAAEAYGLFHEWSSTDSSKYANEEECWSVWQSIRGASQHPATIRTIFKWARDAGWNADETFEAVFQRFVQRIADAANGAELESIITDIAGHTLVNEIALESLADALAKRFRKVGRDGVSKETIKKTLRKAQKAAKVEKNPAIPSWVSEHVFAKGPNRFINIRTFSSTCGEAFNDAYLNQCKHLNGISAKVFALRDCNMMVCRDIGYDPASPDDVLIRPLNLPGSIVPRENEDYSEWLLNSYTRSFTPESPERAEEAMTLVDRHIRDVICVEPGTADLLISWLAWVVQNPGCKAQWSPFIHGGQGIGKGVIGAWMRAVLGHTNVRFLSNESLEEKWIDWLGQCQFVFGNEILQTGQRAMDKLKPIITDETISVLTKYKSSSDQKNIINMMFVSNHRGGLKLEGDDRRFFVIESRHLNQHQVCARYGTDYYDRLYALAKNPDLAAGLRWALLNYELCEGFNPYGPAPRTVARAATIIAGAGDIERAVMEMLGTSPWYETDVLSLTHLYNAIKDQVRGFCRSLAPLTRALESSLGWHEHGRGMVHGSPVTLWVHTSFEGDIMGDPLDVMCQRVPAQENL